MSIVSVDFAVFVAAVLAVYHAAPAPARNACLLLASYVFYAAGSWQFLSLLIVVTVMTFAISRRLELPGPRRRRWLLLGIGVNVGALLLVRFVYPVTPLGAPAAVLGLSFYSLQAISYLVDVYAGPLAIRTSLFEFALYLAYFPKVVAGPIERARTFVPQLWQPRTLDDDALASASTLIVVGMVRKIVIADPLATVLPAAAFATPWELGAGGLLLALVGYSFVLYNDFAGYTSIVRGVSRLFGIELSPNFAQPFFSRSFTEFWNRWHITLSYWLRDYVYLPLSRSLLRRRPSLTNVPNLIMPPMTAMLASGVWHGGSANMMIWGALHGAYLVAERGLNLWRPGAPVHRQPLWQQLGAMAMVFACGTFALIWFRMDVGTAASFVHHLVWDSTASALDPRVVPPVMLSLGLDWTQHRHGEEAAFLRWPRLIRAALVAAALVLCFLATRRGGGAPFEYQSF